MAYCPRCGVEVEDRLDACPLCDTAIPLEVRENPNGSGDYPNDVIPPKRMYRSLTERQRRALFRSVLVFLVLFPLFLTVMLDLSRTGGISWSYFVSVPIAATAVIAWLFYRFGKRPLLAVTATLVIVIVTYGLLSLRMSATLSPILPYFIVVFLAVEGLLLYLVRRRRHTLGIIGFAAVDITLLAVALDLLIRAGRTGGEGGEPVFVGADAAMTGGGWWSPVVAAVLLPIALYAAYLRRVRRKGLNLAGFLFLDLALMMVGIDMAITGMVGWSVVTTLVFVPVAAILYVLHVVLFNDTDWRKALHL